MKVSDEHDFKLMTSLMCVKMMIIEYKSPWITIDFRDWFVLPVLFYFLRSEDEKIIFLHWMNFQLELSLLLFSSWSNFTIIFSFNNLDKNIIRYWENAHHKFQKVQHNIIKILLLPNQQTKTAKYSVRYWITQRKESNPQQTKSWRHFHLNAQTNWFK